MLPQVRVDRDLTQVSQHTPPHTNEVSGDYRADIDGLRAIAVLSVLFFHAGFAGFSGGFTGVDIFFAISGFLIGGHIYAEEQAGRFTFAGFYRRRAKRILPALYVVICATLVLGSALLSPSELRRAATESVATLLSGSNFFFWKITDYFAVASEQRTLLMTWSLGVEEQFYLVVPLLMVWLLRFKIRLVSGLAVLSGLSFCIACYQVAHTPVSAFYLLPARAWELFGGVLVALMIAQKKPGTPISERTQHVLGGLGLLLLLLPIFFLTPAIPFPGPGALLSIVGAALVLCSPRALTNRTVLSAGALRFVGRISYSLYLWHWPLLTFTRIVLGANPSRLQAAAVLAVSFLLATATYYWIEQPFRSSRTPELRLLLRYASATAFLILVCLGMRITYGMAFRAPALATVEKKLEATPEDPCLVRDFAAAPNTSAACVENTGRPAMAVWGDSHAGSIAPALRERAHKAGYNFIETSKSACPPLANTGRYFHEIPGRAKECIAFNNNVLHRLQADPYIQVVILTARWKDSLVEPYEDHTGWLVDGGKPDAPMPSLQASKQKLTASLLRTISSLQKAGKRVLVLQDVAEFSEEPLWHVRTFDLRSRRWLITRLRPGQPIDPGTDVKNNQAADGMARAIISCASRSTGAGLIDLEHALCTSAVACRYRDATHIFYRDNQHLTPAGAQAALDALGFTVRPHDGG
jgi:peptidoglycan/LPS O-acetylase OafA/YrhL